MDAHKVNIIDIGAIGGLEPPWSRHRATVGTVLAFEPAGRESIRGSRISLPFGIWNRDGEATLYLYGGGVGSASLLHQNVGWVRKHYEELRLQGKRRLNASWFDRAACVGTRSIRIRTLDSALRELRSRGHAQSPFHFLKSDTQSGEYPVLEGASTYLRNECVAAVLEVFRYPLFDEMRLESDVRNYMEACGFEAVGWTEWQGSFESQRDLLFARREPRTRDESHILNTIKWIYGIVTGPARFSHGRSLLERLIRRGRITLGID